MTTISRRLFGAIAGLALVALAACNVQNISAPGLAKEKDEAARAVFAAFQKGDLSTLQLGEEMTTPEARAAMPQIVALTPKDTPTNVRLASWRTNWTALSGPRTENMETMHEYTFPGGRMLLVETVMARDLDAAGKAGPWRVRGFHMKPQGGGAAQPGPGPSELAPAPAADAGAPPAEAAAQPQAVSDEAYPVGGDAASGKNTQN